MKKATRGWLFLCPGPPGPSRHTFWAKARRHASPKPRPQHGVGEPYPAGRVKALKSCPAVTGACELFPEPARPSNDGDRTGILVTESQASRLSRSGHVRGDAPETQYPCGFWDVYKKLYVYKILYTWLITSPSLRPGLCRCARRVRGRRPGAAPCPSCARRSWPFRACPAAP